jgi:hypothetical protein
MPDIAIALIAGLARFALGYGVREVISRRRHQIARARRDLGLDKAASGGHPPHQLAASLATGHVSPIALFVMAITYAWSRLAVSLAGGLDTPEIPPTLHNTTQVGALPMLVSRLLVVALTVPLGACSNSERDLAACEVEAFHVTLEPVIQANFIRTCMRAKGWRYSSNKWCISDVSRGSAFQEHASCYVTDAWWRALFRD